MVQFRMDGNAYDVDVLTLTRRFSIAETGTKDITQDGEIHRDLTGTYYNYTMIVAERHGNRAELDRFWEDISKPVACHVCEFPYGQKLLTQRMFVQTGAQDIRRLETGKTSWGEIAVEFIAKKPRVIA